MRLPCSQGFNGFLNAHNRPSFSKLGEVIPGIFAITNCINQAETRLSCGLVNAFSLAYREACSVLKRELKVARSLEGGEDEHHHTLSSVRDGRHYRFGLASSHFHSGMRCHQFHLCMLTGAWEGLSVPPSL